MSPPFFLLLRVFVLLALFWVGVFGLERWRKRLASPARRFLAWFWGSAALLFVFAVIMGMSIWLGATTAEATTAPFTALVCGVCAILSLALAVMLGWWTRVGGERLIFATVHPPEGMTSLRGWAPLPLLLFWLALMAGGFSITYAMVSWFSPAG